MRNLLIALTILFSSFISAQNSEIHLQVDNISNDDGVIAIAVYDNSKNFTKKEIKSLKLKANKGFVSTTIKGLKPGKYALAVLHDENKNGKMDFNLIGVPKEDYGFSNNAKGVLAPPKFKDAAFDLSHGESKKIRIKL